MFLPLSVSLYLPSASELLKLRNAVPTPELPLGTVTLIIASAGLSAVGFHCWPRKLGWTTSERVSDERYVLLKVVYRQWQPNNLYVKSLANSTKQAFSVVIIYSPNTGSGRPSSHQSAIRVFVDH